MKKSSEYHFYPQLVHAHSEQWYYTSDLSARYDTLSLKNLYSLNCWYCSLMWKYCYRQDGWHFPALLCPTKPLEQGRDSSVGIATRYGLGRPGIESRWEWDFPHPSRPALGAHPASYTVGTVSFRGVKRPRSEVDHAPRSSAEVEGRVELYLYYKYMYVYQLQSEHNNIFGIYSVYYL